jgi:aminoglycoside/choline kinase family phosphotransferase
VSPDRAEALARLLEDTGFAAAARTPFPGDASTRSYTRLELNGRRAILMDAPPTNESPPCPPGADLETRRKLGWNALARLAASRVEAFVAVALHLEKLGLSTPRIYGADMGAGFCVVEDLGDDLFARVM